MFETAGRPPADVVVTFSPTGGRPARDGDQAGRQRLDEPGGEPAGRGADVFSSGSGIAWACRPG